jgi:hypothetical protein
MVLASSKLLGIATFDGDTSDEQSRKRMWRVSGRMSMGARVPEEVKTLATLMG